LALAESNGYEAATLERVAERAEVGISTIYRYFANKDAILLDEVESTTGAMADRFRARPEGEDVAVSLGEVVHDVLGLGPEQWARIRRPRAQLDLAPGPRARLWDLWHQQRALLERAVAERSGRSRLSNATAAQLTVMIITMALNHERDNPDGTTPPDYADRIIATLRGQGAPLPVRPGGPGHAD
jgi:AcrR family transcriptional regulator